MVSCESVKELICCCKSFAVPPLRVPKQLEGIAVQNAQAATSKESHRRPPRSCLPHLTLTDEALTVVEAVLLASSLLHLTDPGLHLHQMMLPPLLLVATLLDPLLYSDLPLLTALADLRCYLLHLTLLRLRLLLLLSALLHAHLSLLQLHHLLVLRCSPALTPDPALEADLYQMVAGLYCRWDWAAGSGVHRTPGW
jgi:hypothetical protein